MYCDLNHAVLHAVARTSIHDRVPRNRCRTPPLGRGTGTGAQEVALPLAVHANLSRAGHAARVVVCVWQLCAVRLHINHNAEKSILFAVQVRSLSLNQCALTLSICQLLKDHPPFRWPAFSVLPFFSLGQACFPFSPGHRKRPFSQTSW